jgi:hypothetical protein
MAHPGGRPTKYKPEYCDEIIAFFDIEPYREVSDVYTYKDGTTKETKRLVANDLPFISSFAFKIGVSTETLHEWSRVHPEFSVALKRAKQLQESMLATNGLMNTYAQPFAIFTAKNIAGWRDKTEVESKSEITHKFDELTDDELDRIIKARQDRLSGSSN